MRLSEVTHGTYIIVSVDCLRLRELGINEGKIIEVLSDNPLRCKIDDARYGFCCKAGDMIEVLDWPRSLMEERENHNLRP